AMLLQDLSHGISRRLSMELGVGVGSNHDGGAHVDDIQDLDDMLLLALRISRPSRSIFEIDLPGRHRRWTLQRLMLAAQGSSKTTMLLQNFPDGACRTR